jgi:hypothetical protein
MRRLKMEMQVFRGSLPHFALVIDVPWKAPANGTGIFSKLYDNISI